MGGLHSSLGGRWWRPGLRFPGWVFMRFVAAVVSVIIVSLGLGGAAAYLSVDLTPPGLELLRPAPSATVARVEREEKQRTIQVEASGCKYCAALAEMAKTFSRRAEIARTHAAALQKALPQVSDETQLAALRQDELKAAKAAASRAEAAASVLTGWASRCKSEDFCKAPAVTKVACTANESHAASALLIAAAVHNAAQQCAGASCPAVDCQASAALRADMGRVAQELGTSGAAIAQLPVGPSTVKAELTRITDETNYVANMLPLMLDSKRATESRLNRLAPELADERAVSVAQLASVMEQAAVVSDSKSDPRTEAAWRLKSLATHLAALGKLTSAESAALDWQATADSLGAALTDLARLQAMLDRPGPNASCATANVAAQQLREAGAMLDVCRMRSACIGRGGAGMTRASAGDIDTVIQRAKATADGLIVNEISADENVIQAAAGAEPKLIDVLRSQGVCRRAGQLIQASTAAPVVTQAVATAAVPPALAPAAGVMSPQDVIAGAADTALNAPAVVEGAAPPSDEILPAAVQPRPMEASDPELLPAAATPRTAAAPKVSAPTVSFVSGGEGGPVLSAPPMEKPKGK